MFRYFNHFSVYHWFFLAVGVGMTATGYLVNPAQPLAVSPIEEATNEPGLKAPAAPIVRDGIVYDDIVCDGIVYDSIVYDGICSADLNGKGTITWPSKQIYSGDVRSGLPHGKGNMLYGYRTAHFANGAIHKGDFSDGKPRERANENGRMAVPFGVIGIMADATAAAR